MSSQKKEYTRNGIYKIGQIIFDKGNKLKILNSGKKENTIEVVDLRSRKKLIIKGNIRN
jgi:hypothetical protein